MAKKALAVVETGTAPEASIYDAKVGFGEAVTTFGNLPLNAQIAVIEYGGKQIVRDYAAGVQAASEAIWKAWNEGEVEAIVGSGKSAKAVKVADWLEDYGVSPEGYGTPEAFGEAVVLVEMREKIRQLEAGEVSVVRAGGSRKTEVEKEIYAEVWKVLAASAAAQGKALPEATRGMDHAQKDRVKTERNTLYEKVMALHGDAIRAKAEATVAARKTLAITL